MLKSKWEKNKKYDTLDIISFDEVLILVFGFFIFYFFQSFKIAFILLIVIWHWLKIRLYERKIIKKENEIYNLDYVRMKKEDGMPVNQTAHEKLVEIDRKPLEYDLKQTESKRKFLIDKFVVLNLILIILIELFIIK